MRSAGRGLPRRASRALRDQRPRLGGRDRRRWRARVRCRLARERAGGRLAGRRGAAPTAAGAHGLFPGTRMGRRAGACGSRARPRADVVEGPAIVEVAVHHGRRRSGRRRRRRTAHGRPSIVRRPKARLTDDDGRGDAVATACAWRSSRNRLRERRAQDGEHACSAPARSGVLNTAHDFSCCILTADAELLAAAESLPIHVLIGPDLMARHDEGASTRSCGAATPSCTTRPTTATRTRPTTAMLVPVIDDDGVHRFTVLAKAHQADCGNSLPTTYIGDARDVYEEGALIFPARQVQQRLPGHRRHHPHVPAAHPRARAVVGRLPGAARRGPDRRARAARARRARSAGTRSSATPRTGSTTPSGGWSRRSGGCRPGAVTVTTRARPVPGRARRHPGHGRRSRSTRGRRRIEVDLRDNPDCQPCGLNLTEATAHGSAR